MTTKNNRLISIRHQAKDYVPALKNAIEEITPLLHVDKSSYLSALHPDRTEKVGRGAYGVIYKPLNGKNIVLKTIKKPKSTTNNRAPKHASYQTNTRESHM